MPEGQLPPSPAEGQEEMPAEDGGDDVAASVANATDALGKLAQAMGNLPPAAQKALAPILQGWQGVLDSMSGGGSPDGTAVPVEAGAGGGAMPMSHKAMKGGY